MWGSTRHQTTWIQICVFTFMYSFVGSYNHTNEYYIRRGYKNPTEDDLFLKEDVFGYPKCSAFDCLGKDFFQSEPFTPTVSWPRNITLCSYRCGKNTNTFLPEENKCLLNTDVRNRLGSCTIFFSGESSNIALFVLDVNNNAIAQPLMQNTNTQCQVVTNGQHYYNGNGIWKNISTNCISFYISEKKLMWKSTNATPYMGRIIKLQLQNCRTGKSPNNVNNDCILFKAKGNFHLKLEPCPTPSMSQQTSYVKVSHSSTSPNLTTMASPLIPSTSQQVSLVITSTSYVKVSHSSASPNLTTMASPLIPSTSQQVSVVITPINTPTTSARTEGPTTPFKGSSSGQGSSNKENVIIGVITTCVIVIIICLLVAFWCKRRSNHKNRSSLKAANPSANNPAYEKNDQIIPLSSTQKKPPVEVYDNLEYDYAAVDGVQVHTNNKQQPVYQSLDRGNENGPQIYQSLIDNPDLKKSDNADSKEYSYNHLQHPTYNPPHPKNTSESLYNSLQKPGGDDDYMEPETQIKDNPTGASEPVYNVLEGPDGNPAPQDNDPVYNVLEGPDTNQYPQDNDPVYNVLEGPDTNQYPQDNDPVYNVLEDPDDDYDNAPIDDDQDLPASGQDNIAYSSTIDLKIPQTPSSPDYDVLEDPNGALPDSTYQPLAIRLQDDVYQPLDRTSQPIYQTLEPNDSTA